MSNCNMKNETMRNDDNPRNDAHALLLFALGLVFVFSSLSKWLSVRSFALTVDAFTAFLGYDLLYGHGMAIANMVCLSELALGFAAMVRPFRKYAAWVMPLALAYFTALTYMNVTCPYGQIESCGCFGEFIHLTPWESFCKSACLFLLSLVAVMLRYMPHRTKRAVAVLALSLPAGLGVYGGIHAEVIPVAFIPEAGRQSAEGFRPSSELDGRRLHLHGGCCGYELTVRDGKDSLLCSFVIEEESEDVDLPVGHGDSLSVSLGSPEMTFHARIRIRR